MRRALAPVLLLVACGSNPPAENAPCDGNPSHLCGAARLGTLTPGLDTTGHVAGAGYYEIALAKDDELSVTVSPALSLELVDPSQAKSVSKGAIDGAAVEATGTWFVRLDGTGDFHLRADVVSALAPALPPTVADCATGGCAGTAAANICLEGAATCEPKRSTTVAIRLNGRPFGALGIRVQSEDGVPQIQASGSSWAWAGFLMTNGASSVTVSSDAALQLTYMNLAPVWGGTTFVDLVASGRHAALGDSYFYRFDAYDPGTTAGALSHELETIAREQVAMAGVTPPRYRAWLLPTELGIIVGNEGNLSFGDGTVTINYGNPDWTASQGGVEAVVAHEFSHELTHTIFAQIASKFGGNATCLNEGLADALGNLAGYVPDDDFGTAQDGSDFTQGCLGPTEIHAKGNCVLWNAKRAGLLVKANAGRLFHPEHDFEFDSCDLASERTANALDVYLTESLGQDASTFLRGIGLNSAGSYAAAKAAIGL